MKGKLEKLSLIAFILISLVMLSNQAAFSGEWHWENPLPQVSWLLGVWGSSGSDVFAVGDGGTILHYDGADWSSMTSGTSNALYGVWGSSGSDVFAVGSSGTILHYDGSDWSPMESGTSRAFYGVWGSSGSNVFAVGSSGTILHYDGSDWSPMVSGTSNAFMRVWGSSGSNVFAVGISGTICHYDGISWSPMTSGTSNGLQGVWGSSGSDVFAVGDGGTILHYDGADWSSMESGTSRTLLEVWGSSGSDVFAVGYTGTILHYDGSDWSPMESGTAQQLNGIWGSSSTDYVAVGECSTILHYDGASWSLMGSVTTSDLKGVWGSSTSDVFAVGNSGTICHYDGISWSSMESGTGYTLNGVWGSSGSDVFALVGYGQILHYDGISWSPMSSGTSNTLYEVWGSSGSDVFAVGQNGTILHYDGSDWSPMSSGTSNYLYGVWGNSGSDVFAVGQAGTILHYDGSDWSPMSSGTSSTLRGVWGSSGSDVFVVGDSGTILHYDGSDWSPMESGTSLQLYGVWGNSGSDVFAVGQAGTILHYDGASWSPMTSGASNYLSGVWGSSGSDVFAVGYCGTILHYIERVTLEFDVDQDGIPDGPVELMLCEGQITEIDIWLTDWNSTNNGNIAEVEYYFTWDKDALHVLDITCNNLDPTGQWDTAGEYPSPGSYKLQVTETDSGVTGQKMKLHTVRLKCIDAPVTSWIKASLGDTGYVDPVGNPFFYEVNDGEITVTTVCGSEPINCSEEELCEELELDSHCPSSNPDLIITDDYYELLEDDTTFCKGEMVNVGRTYLGSYPDTIVSTVTICDSECFEQKYEICQDVSIQSCYIKCIKGCRNAFCVDWDAGVCEGYLKEIECNQRAYLACKDGFNEETQESSIDMECGFEIDETVAVRDSDGGCTGMIVDGPHTLEGTGTAVRSIPLPLDTGSYDICRAYDTDPIKTLTVSNCGSACRLMLSEDTFRVDSGFSSSLLITLESDESGTYDLSLERWEDDAHTIEMDVPDSLTVSAQVEIGDGEDSIPFEIDAENPQAKESQTNWSNVIIKAVYMADQSVSCEATFDFEVRNISANGQCEWEDGFPQEGTVYGRAKLGLAPDTYDLYVVDHQESWSDGTDLSTLTCTNCVTNPETSFTTDENGNMGCGTVIWSNAVATGSGEFDIVIDMDDDGYFYEGVDLLDANQTAGFEICADTESDDICNDYDNCSATANGPGGGTCRSGTIGDACMIDEDCDAGWIEGDCSIKQEDIDEDDKGDVCDNCPCHPNTDQLDGNGDGIGDACEAYKGDVDGDEDYDSTDVQKIINFILEVPPAFDYFEFWAADCDDNGEINVCDVQMGINKAME